MKNSRIFRKGITAALVGVVSLTGLVIRPSAKEAENKPQVATPEVSRPRVEEQYGKLPLSFEPNRGQTHKSVKFISRGTGYLLLLTATGATLKLTAEQLRMNMIGANSRAEVAAETQLEGVSNYLIGNDRRNWKTNVPNYAKVRVSEVYPLIDMVYYGSDQQRLEFDFIVKPGGDTSRIVLGFEGARSIRLDDKGSLRLQMNGSEIIQPAPFIYQEVDGQRRSVTGRFRLIDAKRVTFEVGDYDRSRTLVIDPKIIYASMHGGSGDDRINDVTTDTGGNAYIVGQTLSTNLNVTGGIQSTNRGGMDAFLVKINPAGTQRLVSTYLGGNGTDFARGVAIMSDGKICITGATDVDADLAFPTTSTRYQGPTGVFGDRNLDVFVTVLNSSASGLSYSTFLGGDDNDSGNGIAIDAANKIYVSGSALSRDFPTKNEFQKPNRAETAGFIAKFDPLESGNDSLVYSSVIRGNDNNNLRTDGTRVAVTPNGVAFTTGTTNTTSLPVKSSSSLPPLQSTFKGGTKDCYLAKVSPSGALIYLTYFGGDGLDAPTGIAVDANERVYIAGHTTSSAASFPLRNAFDSTRDSTTDGFVAKLNADGTALFYSTFFSAAVGTNRIEGMSIDAAGDAYVTGFAVGTSTLLPINGFQSTLPDGQGFVAKIERSNAQGTNVPRILYFDTWVTGGATSLALDRKGNVYIAGSTANPLPTELTSGVFQPNSGGGPNDGFIAKISSSFGDTIGVFRASSNQFLLRNSNSAGPADLIKAFGGSGDLPIAGDWNGDGIGDFGFFRPSTGQFFLRTNILLFAQTIIISFGLNGDLPVAGDWDGDGIDNIGVFRPSTGEWFLSAGPNSNSPQQLDANFFFGQAGDLPIAGDFDGDGTDGVGVFRPSTGQFFLNNEKQNFVANVTLNFGANGDLPVAGDWNGDSSDGVGVFRPSTGEFFLNNNNISNVADFIFVFGQNGDLPIAGNWDIAPN